MVVLYLLSVVILLVNSVTLFSVARNLEDVGDLPEPEGNHSTPLLSVVVPARNEENTIREALLKLLKVSYPRVEFIVVNDRSSDSTGSIVQSLATQDQRIKLVDVKTLPVGWIGKVHALHEGVSQAHGDWVLLMDADIHLGQNVLRRVMEYVEQQSIDFLTIYPHLRTQSSFVKACMAQLTENLFCLLKPHLAEKKNRKNYFGCGAFILIRHNAIDLMSALHSVRFDVIDDCALAKQAKLLGAQCKVLTSRRGQVSVDWYSTLGAMFAGLEKNSFAFFSYKIGLALGFQLLEIAVLAGLGVGLIALYPPTILVTILYIYARFSLSRAVGAPLFSVFLFPLTRPLMILPGALATLKVLLRGKVTWRGTDYSLKELKAAKCFDITDHLQ